MHVYISDYYIAIAETFGSSAIGLENVCFFSGEFPEDARECFWFSAETAFTVLELEDYRKINNVPDRFLV